MGGMLGNLLMLMEVLRWERSRGGLGDYLLKLDYRGWKMEGRRMSRGLMKFRLGVKSGMGVREPTILAPRGIPVMDRRYGR